MGFCLCALSDPFCPNEVFFGSRIPSPIWKNDHNADVGLSVSVCSQTHFCLKRFIWFKIPLQNLFTAICVCILGSLLHPVDYRARGETGDSNGLFKNFLCQSWSRAQTTVFFLNANIFGSVWKSAVFRELTTRVASSMKDIWPLESTISRLALGLSWMKSACFLLRPSVLCSLPK